MDIVGITLGVVVILIVAGSVVFLARNRMHGPRWPLPAMRGWWNGKEIPFGGREREENDQQVEGAFSEVEVRNVAGSIEVIGCAAGPIGVHSVKTGPSPAAFAALRVDIHQLGDRLVIEEKRDGPAGRPAPVDLLHRHQVGNNGEGPLGQRERGRQGSGHWGRPAARSTSPSRGRCSMSAPSRAPCSWRPSRASTRTSTCAP
jgi:hypothetical protein